MSAEPLPASGDREYPARPIVGVGAVVLCGGDVLLVRRGRAPMPGRWSLPGGVLQAGETMAEGAAREVLEETGIAVEARSIVSTLEHIERDVEGRVRFHYVIVDWLCVASGGRGEPRAGDDAMTAAWVPLKQIRLTPYRVEEKVFQVIRKAVACGAQPAGALEA